ncbi:acyl-phosphate glycerol-3-phosphate acyltransferase [Salsuginibacillus halophilus]|uniref:Glycerol-3-phosphate acyltransferase n=1 Tax=Salsuginibacillus halophilus TaxID=517424 RepID=A0A2P8HW61_9BACI|nr:glycerol-3-phosphate 1-O-acyltransferase PlsY [Salsuginibacillus halophilus]PSL50482.1 acyl-phosphate glycerol-3-phosphate acyltransferase [Salsuginibacillus halophilus]
MDVVIAVLLAYLLGAVSFSYEITKKVKKIDIRTTGSGNAGATNTMRILGTGPAIIVLSLDIIKGIAAVWIARGLEQMAVLPTLFPAVATEGLAPALAGFAAILGHNWPVYYGFRGGKGVATTVGVVASLVFFPAIYVGLAAIAAIIVTRYVSLGSLIFGVFTPVVLWFTMSHYDHPPPYFWFSVAVGVLLVYQHRTNVVRLLRGTESKLGKKSS